MLLGKSKNRRVEFEANKRKKCFDRTHFNKLYHRQALKRLNDIGANIPMVEKDILIRSKRTPSPSGCSLTY